MITLNLETLINLYYTNVVFELNKAKEKINYFTSKYDTAFVSFENIVKSGNEEAVERWDDYLEWKGFQNAIQDLTQKKNDIENGDITVV